MALSLLQKRRKQLDITEKILAALDEIERDIRCSFEMVGKYDTQAKDYDTGELLWEDAEKTIPLYRDKYDYVPKETLTDADNVQLKVVQSVRDLVEARI